MALGSSGKEPEKKGENNEGAKRFLKFLKESQEATAIRDAYGYGTAK